MLGWEHARRELLDVHHLTVLAYHLQHPHLYSPEGLAHARRLLADFVAGLTPTLARARGRAVLGSDTRNWRLVGAGDARGTYAPRPEWTMSAADVVSGGIDEYRARAEHWARTVHTSLYRAGYHG
jgi:hypothetical protein